MGNYVSLQWDAASDCGANGGYVERGLVYYNIYRAEPIYEFGELKEMRLSYLKHVKSLRTDCDVPGMNEGEFENIYFGVCGESEIGEGPMTYIEFQKGEKYNPPYKESFAHAETSTYLEVRTDGTDLDTGVFLTDESCDQDGGAAAFETREAGISVELRTAKIWLAACPQPELHVSTRNVRGANSLTITALTPDNTRTLLATITPGEEYEKHIIDLTNKVSGLWVRFLLTAEFDQEAAVDEGARIDVDDIRAGNYDTLSIKEIWEESEEERIRPTDGNVYSADGCLLRTGVQSLHGLHGIVITNGRKQIL